MDAEPSDLVLTDLGMPELSGWEVAAGVKRRRPATPVGLVTGWGDVIDPAEAATRGVDFVLGKPFQIAQLQAAVARVTARPASGQWSLAGTSAMLGGEAERPRRGAPHGKSARGYPDRRSDSV